LHREIRQLLAGKAEFFQNVLTSIQTWFKIAFFLAADRWADNNLYAKKLQRVSEYHCYFLVKPPGNLLLQKGSTII
jgi:hypothetical protein